MNFEVPRRFGAEGDINKLTLTAGWRADHRETQSQLYEYMSASSLGSTARPCQAVARGWGGALSCNCIHKCLCHPILKALYLSLFSGPSLAHVGFLKWLSVTGRPGACICHLDAKCLAFCSAEPNVPQCQSMGPHTADLRAAHHAGPAHSSSGTDRPNFQTYQTKHPSSSGCCLRGKSPDKICWDFMLYSLL